VSKSVAVPRFSPDSAHKVLERLATSEKTTIVFQRETDGKIRVTSGSWDGEKVILRDQVLEVRNVDGRPRVARKEVLPRRGGPLRAALRSVWTWGECERSPGRRVY
jgi:hypothetical protein